MVISIHALREEGDHNNFAQRIPVIISIHALREEGDQMTLEKDREALEFLSTPSARRATTSEDFHCIREPISIHALREEGDAHSAYTLILVYKFLSTPSARRATLG